MIGSTSNLKERPGLDRGSLSGVELSVALVIIAMLAAVPFVTGSVVRATRAAETRRNVACLADALRVPTLTTPLNVYVLRGEGRNPGGDSRSQWFQAVGSLDRELEARGGSSCPTTDPWLQAYLVNARANAAIWVVSAGANGILETAFEATTPDGDDIGSRVR